jgi:predicted dehydrogenase
VKPLRIAVVGAGHMGRSHARKVALLAAQGRVTLCAVVDRNLERAGKLAAELGTSATADAAAAFAAADAAIVAVPASAHAALASAALEAGLDVLVEKPIAATLAEGEALVALAARRGRVLQVGHLEWWNPVLRGLRSRIAAPRFVEAQRMGPFPERGTDVDVVRDLMIHDLDIVQQLVGEEPERIDSIGVPVLSDAIDIANARLGFASGCVANLTASRVSAAPVRKLRIFQADGYLSLDLLAAQAVVSRRGRRADGTPALESERLDFEPADALLAQLVAFAEAARTRDTPAVSGRDGVAALRSALRVVEAMPRFGDPR